MIRALKNLYHLIVAYIANVIYRWPSHSIRVIGVTGTDGKTTTTSLIYHILRENGRTASMVSTVYAKVGDSVYDTGFHVSTPHSFTVQRFLREAVANGDEFFVMESTSHALDQNRVWGVRYSTSVITNITHEHLDYHKTYENYVKAKTKLLLMSNTRIVNREDKSYPHILKIIGDTVITYGLQEGDVVMDIAKRLGRPLAHFSKYNFLAAYCVCKAEGLTEEQIFAAMKTFVMPPGRMEVISEKPFTVIVDFAHTPNSIKEALEAVQETYMEEGKRLIHVFGCAARRDSSKRPLMGRESALRADFVIITEEDYRDEDPEKIAQEIGAGLESVGFTRVEPEAFGHKRRTYTVIHNRHDALEKAIQIAEPGDVVISTGKGHERSLCRGSTEFPWDEQDTLRRLIAASS
ncbi:MAG: Mur ligase family protein [Patescibacteria group bacterium]|nr:Mur ligase family protein [Patescibacteria group bacterium]